MTQDVRSSVDGDGDVLIVTAVEAERDALLRGLRNGSPFDVVAGGVGPAAAAASAAARMARRRYRLAICAGIGGGFPGRAEVGALVVADEAVAADLGTEAPEGFLSLDRLGFGSIRIPADEGKSARLAEALRSAGLPVVVGPVLTVSSATGTGETAKVRAMRVPGAAAEAMEGYGVAVAAQNMGVPFLEIRAVSNPVGPRNRGTWKIEAALERLAEAGAVIREVFG
ncbi:futalosine hydrolase [Planifilum fimeticola]|uniref:Futalosine hydrolase n=1 Tax=Planifilum fimeticola TaxID=201975 RepID=A0A2T0LJU7_9BACL|nr:futalosine hydrolase [Planifilum fimeticola]PRX42690.1 futalosine hydrolase [Planifilum fimeticola]